MQLRTSEKAQGRVTVFSNNDAFASTLNMLPELDRRLSPRSAQNRVILLVQIRMMVASVSGQILKVSVLNSPIRVRKLFL